MPPTISSSPSARMAATMRCPTGTSTMPPARLSAKKVYTICLTAQDGGSFDLSPDAKEVTLSVVLAR